MEFSSYISGFTDGEGCFSISFKRSKLKIGIEVRPSFSLSQHKRNLEVLKKIHDFFKVGSIRYSKRDSNFKYEVRSIKDLVSVIIPFFEKNQLLTSKRRDFEIFSKVCKLIYKNEHLKSEKLIAIVNMAYQMNKSGKRKYQNGELLSFVTR